MRSFAVIRTAILTSLATVTAKTASQQPDTTLDEATQFSLIYGYPLIAYAKVALPIVSSEYGTNSLEHRRELATPDQKGVVRPNVDTIYSHSILDLSHEDVVIEIPKITDRYWVYPFYDVYGNNYANLGNINKSPSGKYRVRYANAVGEEPGITICDEKFEHSECDGYQGLINAPTPYGALITRLLVKNNGTDLEKVHSTQNQTSLYTVPRGHPGKPFAPKLTTTVLNGSLSSDIPTRIMQMTARFAPDNPPRNISDLSHVNNMLYKAGIHDGHFKPSGANLTHLAQQAEDAVSKHASLPRNIVDLKNDWQALTPSAQGDYHLDYKMRYYVAGNGYLALTATEALYPTYLDSTTNSQTLTLGPKEAYTITFNGKPPLIEHGFWSITVYNKEQYLVPNPINQYALGDRSNLTYADGSLVYSKDAKNATFQVLVQPADIQPPKNWTSNWLPAPPGGGDISITFRLYGPAKALIDGVWSYPVVNKHNALEG